MVDGCGRGYAYKQNIVTVPISNALDIVRPQGLTWQNIVTVPISNALVITDNALEGISIFGDSAHESFQEVHGAFPPQLLEFITGEERWDVRMVALLLWVVKASGAIPGGGWRGTGPYDLHPDPPNTPMPPASYRLWQSYAALLPKECEMCCLLNYSPEEAKELQAKEFVSSIAFSSLLSGSSSSDTHRVSSKNNRSHLSPLPVLISISRLSSSGTAVLASVSVEANAQYKWVKFMHEQYFSSKGGELSKLKLAEKMEDTFWATSMVRSRTFSEDVGGEGITLMVPFADLANHSFGHNSTFSIGLDKSMFCLRSLKPIPAGSEAIISYGQDKCNASLQRDYGFIIPGQPNDIIRFPSKGKNCPEGLTKLHPQVLLPAVSMAGDLAKQQLYPTDSRVGSSSWLAGVATAGSPGSLVPIDGQGTFLRTPRQSDLPLQSDVNLNTETMEVGCGISMFGPSTGVTVCV
eukprot:gene17033-23325_t